MNHDDAQTIRDAATTGAAVNIARRDGRNLSGVPIATSDRYVFKIATGKRGRPALVHVDDVVDVALAEAP